jgi:hypothetical protein
VENATNLSADTQVGESHPVFWHAITPPYQSPSEEASRLGAQYVRVYETPGFIDHDHKRQQFLPILDELITHLQTLFISYPF